MYGNRQNGFRPRAGGVSGRPSQPAVPAVIGNSPFQNPDMLFPANPAFASHFQNQNFLNQNVRGHNFQPQNPIWPHQNPGLAIQNAGFTRSAQLPGSSQPQNFYQNPREQRGKIERAVAEARQQILSAGESVSAWKVSQKALSALQVDSWNSLGIKMQEVPSLHRLMMIEGKVNAFIHCFVGVRGIISLYDLEVAICKNEGVDQFEQLELGPLLKHPLVMHYFSVHSGITEVFKITSEEIIFSLSEIIVASENKEIKVEEFLDFIAKKRSVKCKQLLGIRVQSLGMHISPLREARKSEEAALRKCVQTLRSKNDKFCRRAFSSSQKKQLDERFSAISQRVESFSSVEKAFSGKHIRFISSSSENEDSDDSTKDDRTNVIIGGNQSILSSQYGKSSDRVSNCPYPSATEEMTRLGLRVDLRGHSSTNGKLKKGADMPPKKKRKSENVSHIRSASMKDLKKQKIEVDALPMESSDKTLVTNSRDEDLLISDDSLKMFVTIWKESCQEHNLAEVLQRMLHFYGVKCQRRVRMRDMFSVYPFIGLLNVAISSIKSGMWNSIYDTFQSISQNELAISHTDKNSEYETIDVEPSLDDERIITKDNLDNVKCIAAEDIIKKLGTYFDLDDKVLRNSNSPIENRIVCLRELCKCEKWVAEQFCVKNFSSLGYGDFVLFIENYASQLPPKLLKLLVGGTLEKSSLEACILSNQLVVLVSQALSCLWEGEKITKPMISCLLARQFPSIGFELMENASLEEFLDAVGKHKASVTSKCVLFSATMIEKYHYGRPLDHRDDNQSEITTDGFQICQKTGDFGTVTGKNAIKVLLRAPMLSDLSKWSHWDLVFEPVLGSLISWLVSEVNTTELLCLVTRNGRVIRIDHSATVDSFLEAAVQGSSFLTALKLLSVFVLVGGEKYVKLTLLKCHACHAFEVLLANSLENMEVSNDENSLLPGEALCRVNMSGEASTTNGRSELCKQIPKMSKAVSALSRFVLDCLGYLPAEIHCFAVDVLLSGMRSVFKDAATTILHECKNLEQRLMLHEVGLSLGISDWIGDYQALSSNDTFDLYCAGDSCLEAAKTEIRTGLAHCQDVLNKFSMPEENAITSVGAGRIDEDCTEISQTTNREKSIRDNSASGHLEDSSYHDDNGPSLLIESIRRDEFGLDPCLSDTESSMLKKQHARLGRALHCLSQELYSQDSHFILELVQNADDNTYADDVEPTLAFILQDSGIVVLNNEQGFSPQNMRALCDVGNSTKKGSVAGYIGKKGIGFKSVFRVTDAPEIHSNGFHVKFDIREGQIGFVLPTVVPPCDINLFSRMASAGTDSSDNNYWNTCIVLPFRSCLSEGTAMNSIMTMFSDLHPSLLLFLHRLQCIQLRNLLDDTLIFMKKEILGDGIIKVSHGKEKMTWFVVSQKLQTNSLRSDVQTTEISMAFTLKESDNGYSPCLDLQPVFAFLPLRTYGLKFILQGDFILPSSREEVDGDSPWNQWLLSEYPNLLVRAQREFCELPCFRGEPGKAVSAFMSFVPLVGEVHGFFSSLPRLIVSKLRMTNCLLIEGDNNQWVPPCKVLRGWTEQVRTLIPDGFLHEHLGLRYLNKNIALSDKLASALGIEEFGPNILVRIISSLCHTKRGILSMGISWLASCLNTLYVTLFNSYGSGSIDFQIRGDILKCLRSIRFVPLSDGSFSSVNEGTIWLQSDMLNVGSDGENKIEAFPGICAKLRTVSPSLFSASAADTSSLNMILLDNITKLLQSIGVQRLSAHDIVKLHILPSIFEDKMADREKMLMIEYLCFVMLHLKSSCADCFVEREHIKSMLQCKYPLSTNFGFKCPADVPIHFCRGFGNPVNPKMLADAVNMSWHEVDIGYLKHPANESLSIGLAKWREFFEEIGVTDFAQVLQVNKRLTDVPDVTFKHEMWDRGLIFPESIAKDWESPELVQLVSLLSKSGSQENCKYLLAILDTLWDAGYGDKCTGYFYSTTEGNSYPFRSTFICSLCDVRWVVSSVDEELHYPKDLFYDCEAVRMILGGTAPYATPKVKSERLVRDIGFKTTVSLGDILDIFKVWRNSKDPFKASIMQMSKLYAFIWTEMAASKQKTTEELMSVPFIFYPYSSVSSHDEVVCGMLLSSHEVYWHDPTGSIEKMKEIHPQRGSTETTQPPINKSLYNIYPGLHGFFVDECGVHEAPSLRSYAQILLQLSSVTLPSQAANKVFQVFLHWADGLKSDLLSSDDIIYLKECLATLEYPMLPTVQDKWVSLHPSFGLVCWCDDENLKQEFKHLDNLDFLYFGELNGDDIEMLQPKLSPLMKILGIPVLSEIVTREAIYYGLADCSMKASLINWTLPYAQRYIHKLHSDKYGQLKQSGFNDLNQLKVIVVEKLFCRNVIKNCGSKSNKRVECSCLLQDNMLYTTQGSDYHALFMELSRLFFDGTPELHLANFLHMITTMAESGSPSEHIEFFILNSQAMPKLPQEESIWLLSSVLSSTEIETQKFHLSDLSPLTKESHLSDFSPSVNDQVFSRRKTVINSNWPPVDWKTAPDYNYACASGFKTQAPQVSGYVEIEKVDESESITPIVCADQKSITAEGSVKDELAVSTVSLVFQETDTVEYQYCHDYGCTASNLHTGPDPVSLVGEAQDVSILSPPSFSWRERLQTGTPDTAQTMVTGRLGERLAFKYFVEKVGKSTVKWVNESNETGLPYDITFGEETNEEFIEVKATRSPRKDWFNISLREWQYAVDKGEAFSIAHVALMGNNVARITILKNPVKLCQQGQLQLAVMMPRQQKELPAAS